MHLLGNLLGGRLVLDDELTGGWHSVHRRGLLVALLEVLLDLARLLFEAVLLQQGLNLEQIEAAQVNLVEHVLLPRALGVVGLLGHATELATEGPNEDRDASEPAQRVALSV